MRNFQTVYGSSSFFQENIFYGFLQKYKNKFLFNKEAPIKFVYKVSITYFSNVYFQRLFPEPTFSVTYFVT